MRNPLFYLVRRWLSRRYTVVVAPHQAGQIRRFSVGWPGISAFLGTWSLITILGWGFFIEGGVLWSAWAQAQIDKARVKLMAKEIISWRRLSGELVLLEGDLRHLMGGAPEPGQTQAMAVELDRLANKDTINQLLMGKVSRGAIQQIRSERRHLEEGSASLLASVSSVLFDNMDRANRERSVPTSPPAYGMLTSRFGMRFSPFHSFEAQTEEGHGEYHRGVDIANAEGTPIRAASSGIVRHSGWIKGYGRTIIVDHGFGYSTLYGHTSKIVVSNGDLIQKGDTIAYMGTTGRSTGSHLHFEVWQHGRPINPMAVVRREEMEKYSGQFARKAPETTLKFFEDAVGGGAPQR